MLPTSTQLSLKNLIPTQTLTNTITPAFTVTPTQPALDTPPAPAIPEAATPQTTPWYGREDPLLPAPVYFLSSQSGSQQIWRAEVEDLALTQVTHFAEPVVEFGISPATGRLAFIKGDSLWLADETGANPQAVSLAKIHYSQEDRITGTMLAWSPDGTALALGGRNGLWLYRVDLDSWEQVMAWDREYAYIWVDPRWAWAPDGTGLLVKTIAENSDFVQIVYVSISTGDIFLPDRLGAGHQFSWSVDGKSVYASAYFVNVDWGMEPGLLRWSVESNTTTPLIGSGELRTGNNLSFVAGTQEGPQDLLYFFLGSGEFMGYLDRDETASLRLYRAHRDDLSDREALRSDTFDCLQEVLWAPDMNLAVILECDEPGYCSGAIRLITPDDRPPIAIVTEGMRIRWGKSE
ncbi:MAG: hypothetical protein EHM70_00325 [Chloroflexota bacterium]|nr:MAG: hypothetical protein EHM70_00325 [Chloroflexota bacterium]